MAKTKSKVRMKPKNVFLMADLFATFRAYIYIYMSHSTKIFTYNLKYMFYIYYSFRTYLGNMPF